MLSHKSQSGSKSIYPAKEVKNSKQFQSTLIEEIWNNLGEIKCYFQTWFCKGKFHATGKGNVEF